MIKTELIELYTRDLKKLRDEIALYEDTENLWKIEHSIKNSGGNLCLHIIGNLKTYIGNGIANIGYVRNREFEFSASNIAREKLYKEIDETIELISNGLKQISEEELQANFPLIKWKEEKSTIFTLLHLHAHLNYHLGQINYHRRLLDKNH